jgi:CheY-like chemotaxis protein
MRPVRWPTDNGHERPFSSGTGWMSNGTTNGKLHVLFVEDEVLVSALMSEVLDQHGFAVHAVETGEAALDYLNSGAPVDVLFTDINMPGEIDGTLLAQEARKVRPDLPIVYASGRYESIDIRTVPRSMFLPKPYDPDEAVTLIGRLAPQRHN